MQKEESFKPVRIKTEIWWPIRILMRFFNPPSTSVLTGLSSRKDQPIELALGEPVELYHLSGKRPVLKFWSCSMSLEGAKNVRQQLTEMIDQAETWPR